MALGYCKKPDCQKLVPIEPGQVKHEGSLERWWWPVMHDKPDGTRCTGHERKYGNGI